MLFFSVAENNSQSGVSGPQPQSVVFCRKPAGTNTRWWTRSGFQWLLLLKALTTRWTTQLHCLFCKTSLEAKGWNNVWILCGIFNYVNEWNHFEINQNLEFECWGFDSYGSWLKVEYWVCLSCPPKLPYNSSCMRLWRSIIVIFDFGIPWLYVILQLICICLI